MNLLNLNESFGLELQLTTMLQLKTQAVTGKIKNCNIMEVC